MTVPATAAGLPGPGQTATRRCVLRHVSRIFAYDSTVIGGFMRRLALAAVGLVLLPGSINAQSLSERFSQLFTFGDCGQPLCLDVTNDHGSHYIPSVTQGENDLLAFLTGSIATSLGNLAFTSATSGVTFRIDATGVPVATSVSGGPIFAERSQTLGRGRFLVGANVNGITMDNVRGVPLSDLELKFTHQNVQAAALGDPPYERDIIEVTTDMSLSLLVTSVFASYGVLNDMDIGVLVPIVRASMDGTSSARLDAYQPGSPHLFDGTSETAETSAEGSAIGIGDIAVRAKINLHQTPEFGFALLADARLPTGDEENFLGSGNTSIRGLGILSGSFGNFSPHLNAGFAYRSGENQNHSMLATLGFDQLVSDQMSIAAELIGDFEMGDPQLILPQPVVFTAPTVETVDLTDIPDEKDNRMDAAFGIKFLLGSSMRGITNILFPLNDGGLRPKFLWTVGIERTF
jgi:hypothetical protein